MKKETRRTFLKRCLVFSAGLVRLTTDYSQESVSTQEKNLIQMRNQAKYLMKTTSTREILHAGYCPPEKEGYGGYLITMKDVDGLSEEKLKRLVIDLKFIYRGQKEFNFSRAA